MNLASIQTLATDPALAHLRTAPAALLTANRSVTRRSIGRHDIVLAGRVSFAVHPDKDGVAGGWGIVAANAKKFRSGPDGEWSLSYEIRPPTAEELTAVVAAMADRWVREAGKIINLPLDDDRHRAEYDARAKRLRALVVQVLA